MTNSSLPILTSSVAAGAGGAPSTLTTPVAAAGISSGASSSEFMAMLGQMVDAATPASSTSTQTNALAVLPVLSRRVAANADDPAAMSAEMLATLPVVPPSIPVIDLTQTANVTRTDATIHVTGDVLRAAGPSVAMEAQFVTDLIRTEQSSARESLMPFDALSNVAAPEESAPQTKTVPSDAAYSRPVHASVGSSQWADEIGSRLTMMAEQGKQTASLRLSPEHLGPLEIRIAMQDDKASVWFGAAHADTRAAIETALPRLRELFAAQGLSLTDAGVSQHTPREQSSQPQNSSSSSGEVFGDESTDANSRQVQLGLVDAYA